MQGRFFRAAIGVVVGAALSAGAAAQPGAIAGTLRAAKGLTPIEGAQILVFDAFFDVVAAGETLADGSYETSPVSAGSYVVLAMVDGYVDELFADRSCELGLCDLSAGTAVTVLAGLTTSSRDFDLSDPDDCSISGQVLEQGSSAPIEGAEVRAWHPALSDFVRTTHSAADGSYLLGELPEGGTFVVAGRAPGRIDELHANLACPLFSCDPGDGSAVNVEHGSPSTGVNFLLAPGGTISGTVTRSDTGAPVDGAPIGIRLGGVGRLLGLSGADGSYSTVSGLPDATYRVWFTGSAELRAELFADLPLVTGRPVTDGAAVVLAGGSSAVAELTPDPRPVYADAFETGGAGRWSAGAGIEVCGVELCVDGGPAPASPSCDPCVEQIVAAHPECATTWESVCVAGFWTVCATLACW